MPFEEVNQDIEIEDSENYRAGEENKFNHQSLVMSSMKKVLELGAQDLIEGYWDQRVDKFGNLAKTYHPDSRKAYINSIKNLLALMLCDFDDQAKKDIPILINSIKDKKDYWLKEEYNYWNKLSRAQKDILHSQGKSVAEGFFNPNNNFLDLFIEDEVEIYRQILTKLNELTARLDFYGSRDYEN